MTGGYFGFGQSPLFSSSWNALDASLAAFTSKTFFSLYCVAKRFQRWINLLAFSRNNRF
jgi:hypothetical protein